jgi:hypothetical protein
MARRNANSFEKRMREQAKRERAAAKRQRKAERDSDDPELGEDGEPIEATEPVEAPEVLMEQLAELHRRYDDGEISLDVLDEERAAITAKLMVE